MAKPEYVVNTSEFNDVKGRLAMLHNRRKVDTNTDSNRPRLRRAPGSGTGPVDENEDGTKPKTDSGRASHAEAPRRLVVTTFPNQGRCHLAAPFLR